MKPEFLHSAVRCLAEWVVGFLLSTTVSISTALAAPVSAQDESAAGIFPSVQWDAGGSLRLRYEWKQGFMLGTPSAFDPQDYLLSQFRLHALIHRADQWGVFVEGQDARVHNAFLDNAINDKTAANTFSDQFDLHQAYVDIGWGDAFSGRLRMGRQKFNFGAQRLVASLEWVNTARVWDGVRITQHLGGSDRVVDVLASQLVPVRPERFNSHALTGNRMFDSRFYGFYFTDKSMIPAAGIDAYLFIRDNKHAGDHVNTFGLRYTYRNQAWDSDGEVMAQSGHFGFLRHQAFAAHVGVGRQLSEDVHFGVAYNYGSGDGNTADSKHRTFDNLYPLNHAYYGYMDLASLQNIHNAESAIIWKVRPKSKIRLAYEAFWLDKSGSDAWYNAGGGALRTAAGSASSYVGSEIDLTYSTMLNAWPLTILAGYSHFFAGAYVGDTGTSSDANFFFAQSKWSF